MFYVRALVHLSLTEKCSSSIYLATQCIFFHPMNIWCSIYSLTVQIAGRATFTKQWRFSRKYRWQPPALGVLGVLKLFIVTQNEVMPRTIGRNLKEVLWILPQRTGVLIMDLLTFCLPLCSRNVSENVGNFRTTFFVERFLGKLFRNSWLVFFASFLFMSVYKQGFRNSDVINVHVWYPCYSWANGSLNWMFIYGPSLLFISHSRSQPTHSHR